MLIPPRYPEPFDEQLDSDWAAALIQELGAWDDLLTSHLRRETSFVTSSSLTTAFSTAGPTDITFPTPISNISKFWDEADDTNYRCSERGIYLFAARLTFDSASAGSTSEWDIKLVTTARSYTYAFAPPSVNVPGAFQLVVPVCPMELDDTAKITITRVAGTDTITLDGNAEGNQFSGYLVEPLGA